MLRNARNKITITVIAAIIAVLLAVYLATPSHTPHASGRNTPENDIVFEDG